MRITGLKGKVPLICGFRFVTAFLVSCFNQSCRCLRGNWYCLHINFTVEVINHEARWLVGSALLVLIVNHVARPMASQFYSLKFWFQLRSLVSSIPVSHPHQHRLLLFTTDWLSNKQLILQPLSLYFMPYSADKLKRFRWSSILSFNRIIEAQFVKRKEVSAGNVLGVW